MAGRYAQYFNKAYRRTGTLWEGRHHSSLIQSEHYLMICMRYIELNPVRANMVNRPEDYFWSSYHANGMGEMSWLSPHYEYLCLGPSIEARCHAYRELLETKFDRSDLPNIRNAVHYNYPVGDDQFRQKIEQKFDIKLGQAKRGRPRKLY